MISFIGLMSGNIKIINNNNVCLIMTYKKTKKYKKHCHSKLIIT